MTLKGYILNLKGHCLPRLFFTKPKRYIKGALTLLGGGGENKTRVERIFVIF